MQLVWHLFENVQSSPEHDIGHNQLDACYGELKLLLEQSGEGSSFQDQAGKSLYIAVWVIK
jgi:hypothetical protein